MSRSRKPEAMEAIEPTPVIVITHDRSHRRESILCHLNALKLPHEMSAAVFPEGAAPWSEHYDDETRRRQLGYSMTRGEVGCFLAHRRVWATIIHRRLQAALVIEDDARLAPTAGPALAAIAQALHGRSCFARLISEPHPAFRPWLGLGEHGCLAYPVRPGNLTVAYLLTLACAKSLLKHSESFSCPVDDFMNLEHLHGAIGLHLEPPIAEHHDDGKSLIGKRSKPAMKRTAKLAREIRRARSKIALGISRELTLWRLGIRFKAPRTPRS